MIAKFRVVEGVGVGVGVGVGAAVNCAVTNTLAVGVNVHEPVPLHGADQPVNVDPLAGVAVSVTVDPLAKLAKHVLPQLIPAGLEVTVPAPVPEVPMKIV